MSTEQSNYTTYKETDVRNQCHAKPAPPPCMANVIYYADAAAAQRSRKDSDPSIEDEEWVFTD
ncbi:hypothetical protein [Reinekea sp. G2M2-21]|uniref:hypothetical protein n=1 Tax=Reinekea sp. G2M2-21 TaxID=2788942 RepID=UPI0018A93BF1|nr:hypothetical protein [Reinekea sp. G2M2-21]